MKVDFLTCFSNGMQSEFWMEPNALQRSQPYALHPRTNCRYTKQEAISWSGEK